MKVPLRTTCLAALLVLCPQQAAASRSPMPEFKNAHLSYSRLSRFEQCPLSFKLHYVDGLRAEPGVPLRFGKAIHAVLEVLVREHMEAERSGPLSEDRAADLWQEAWIAEGLSGVDVFEEGLDILRRFVREQGALDHHDVLAVEKEFQLKVGPFTVLGFIDRVDRLDDESVVVWDYKSNRQLFTRDEVDSSLQLSLYEVAVRQLWPWVKHVKLAFWMLRHGIRQETSRTQEQLEAALRYVETVGQQTEQATEFPPRLNTNCVWCDHRQGCPAYADALAGKRSEVCSDLSDLEAVAREREEVAHLAKILTSRRYELDAVLKGKLKHQDELILGGRRYAMYSTSRTEYPLEPTVELLGNATGLSWQELIPRLATVDNKQLEAVLKEASKTLGRSKTALLKAELEANADKSYSPRLWVKAVTP